jgi:DNA-binding response OmpR family regulator
MPDKVLLIEDDEALGGQIVEHLQRAGFEATWWRSGRRILPGTAPDVALVVLDLMLPGVYGLDVLKDLRAISDTPVLVLSARNDTSDKVRALKLGADDYMTKPFWPEELVERVRARLRRPVLQREGLYAQGDLRIDFGARSVTMVDRPVELTRVEFDMLAALARRPGAAITRRWLAENVLDPERDGGERTLDVHASRLRKKLGVPGLIETVWGIGYRLSVKDGR